MWLSAILTEPICLWELKTEKWQHLFIIFLKFLSQYLTLSSCKFPTLSIFPNWRSNFLAGVQFSGQWSDLYSWIADTPRPPQKTSPPPQLLKPIFLSNHLNSAPDILFHKYKIQKIQIYVKHKKLPLELQKPKMLSMLYHTSSKKTEHTQVYAT